MKRFFSFFVIFFFATTINMFGQDPVVEMVSVDDITFKSASFTANLVSKGGWAVSKRGIVVGTDPLPTRANGGTLSVLSGSSVGEYTRSLSTLAHNTTYYVRAFVTKTSPADTCYSENVLSFTTPQAIPPTILPVTVSNIGLMEATIASQITDKGDATIQSTKGFVYSTNQNFTYSSATKATVTGSVSDLPFDMVKNITNLQSGQTYYVKAFTVVKYGPVFDTVYSDMTSFTTHHACGTKPFNIYTTDIAIDSANIHFTKGEGQVAWELDYDFAGHTVGEGTILQVDDTVVTLRNLEGGRSYSVFVRAVCEDQYSEWSDVRTFVTLPPLCAPIHSLRSTQIGYSSAVVEWTPGSMSQTIWEVCFAKSNEQMPETGTIIRNNPIFSPIGLTPQTEYKLKVRAICGDYYSDWSEEFSFNTIQQSIEEADAADKIAIYPNPTDNTIFFEGNLENVTKIKITNSLGQIVYCNDRIPDSFSFGSNKGVFFVSIYGNKGYQIEKIIVQ